ncbi:MAG: glutaredoxin family protein [Deltaproteobacteria bacterium]|jgi:glutaredoxin|nr:glutaredoxin family protein [Deltaproteobacteria bacterium]MBW2531567.1 glutaredoxin family protein [Deltaproteobacteria bacterium]
MLLRRVALCLLVLTSLAGCPEEESDDGTKPQVARDLPALSLKDDTPNLLITWVDDKGNTHTEVTVADVPEEGRRLVRVVITDKSEGQGGRFYVADLTTKGVDGTYPVRTMSRLEWEREIEKRRKAYLAKVAPPPPTSRPSSAATDTSTLPADRREVVAIVYGAEWCGPCHQAKAHLKKRGVRVIYKDVDRDPKAQAELQSKLRRVGKPGAAIPVIDVGGQVLIGYSPGALDAAVKRAQRGTAL